MNLKKLIDDVKPHAIVILAFFLVGYVYYIKTFNGKSHKEEDVTQGLLKGTEIRKYTDKDGEFPGWTNSIFSGMPSVMIQGKPSNNVIKNYNYLWPINASTSYPFKILFLSFIGFYLLMNAFKVKPTYGALAALAYGFATYSISSVEAAHYTKVQAMALMPALLASLHLLFTGRFFVGGVTLAFNMALQIYYFHYQITFYSLICLVVMGIYYVIVLVKEKNIKQLLIATVISVVAIGAGVASNITKIKTTSHFAENTMRFGNDLARAGKGEKGQEGGKSGLDRDYAFAWSYSKGETFTLLIPNFYGGSSREKLSKNSKFYEATQNDQAVEEGLPLYHGDLTFTSGPIYIGAIIIFLFVLGLIVVKDPIKWPLIALTLISFMLGWGRHLGFFNNFLFDNLPYFNKFRVPMMAFCIAQVTMPLLGFLGIKYLYDNWQTQKANNKKPLKTDANAQPVGAAYSTEVWKKVKLAFYIVGGFCLLMAVMGPAFVDMGGAVDEELKAGGNGNLIPVLKEDRESLLRKDAIRSFVFIAIAFGLLWAWYTNKMKKMMAIGLIGAFAAVDLIGVDWRYLSWDDFQFEQGMVSEKTPDAADKEILADKDLHFRVFDLTNDPFNNNEGAAFHKMIGGYDPAKLSRYQDLISEFLSKSDHQGKALDMLNCKYLMGADSGRRIAMARLTNNGNAWFVQQLSSTDNALNEMNKLKTINNKIEATFNSDFDKNKNLKSGSFVVDSSSTAKLLSYHPDTLHYQVDNAHDGYLVFSEIYYDNWRAEIDGKPVDLNKVNYTLRGISVPAGQHKVRLYFDKGKPTTDMIEKVASVTILVLMLVMILLWLRTYFKTEKTTVLP
jgi:hypothetical protein